MSGSHNPMQPVNPSKHIKVLSKFAENKLEIINAVNKNLQASQPFIDGTLVNISSKNPKLNKYYEKEILEHCEVNASDNNNFTLLHELIILRKFDVAKWLIQKPKFDKINYLAQIKRSNSGTISQLEEDIHISALELALTLDYNDVNIQLDFFEKLLQYGASTNTYKIQDLLIKSYFRSDAKDRMLNLIIIFCNYGTKFNELENKAKQFISKQPSEIQKDLKSLFADVKKGVEENIEPKKPLVELTSERQCTGKLITRDLDDDNCLIM
jgi:hypothetical protein